NQKQLPAAEELHRQALAIRQELVDRFKDEPEHHQHLASSHAALAIVLAFRNRHTISEEHFLRAIEILDQLHTKHPAVKGYIDDLITQHDNLARLLNALDRQEDAVKHWRRRIALKEELARAHHGVAMYRSDLGRTLHELGTQLVQYRKLPEARTCFQEAKSQQQMALALARADVDCRLLLCAHSLSVADVLAALKDHSQAVKETIEVLPLAPPQWPQYPVAAAILA